MRSVVSADWVLPVGAPPLRDGAVAIEDGRIAAVGPQSELGRGRRYEDAVIAPGLVNCHSHLEYAVYAGFGDGLADFSDWIGVHVERKRRLEPADVLDVARLGAAECLACGVTTVGDCSFTGAAASACGWASPRMPRTRRPLPCTKRAPSSACRRLPTCPRASPSSPT